MGVKSFKTGAVFVVFATIISLSSTAPAFADPVMAPINTSVSFPEPLQLPEATSNARQAVEAHLQSHAATWGINPAQLLPANVLPAQSGLTTVRYQQAINSVPVLGSLVALTVNRKGSLESLTIKTGSTPGGSAVSTKDDVVGIAKSALAKEQRVDVSTLKEISSTLNIAAPGLAPYSVQSPSFVWAVRLSSPSSLNVMTEYVDDATQKVVYETSSIRPVADVSPLVCDLQTSYDFRIQESGIGAQRYIDMNNPNLPLPICSKSNADIAVVGDPSQNIPADTDPIAATDVRFAQAGINETLNYYSQVIGIDINDEQFLGNISPALNYNSNTSIETCTAEPLRDVCQPRTSAFTSMCPAYVAQTYCNYGNAFWTAWQSDECRSGFCSGIYFGRGFAADDVVGHELTHGVTGALAFNSDALSQEASALSEAFSDFFGEAIDQVNVRPGEKADRSWAMGEDVGYTGYAGPVDSTYPGAVVPSFDTRNNGPFRTMSGTEAGAISQITASYKDCANCSHDNNGPANRFAWLIANGGTQAGITVSPIGTVPADGLCEMTDLSRCTGITKMTKLAYAAVQHLTSSATYLDFSREMRSACVALTSDPTSGFTPNDCTQVKLALDATGISDGTLSYTAHPTKVKKNKNAIVSVALISSTGVPINGVKAQLQIYSKKKWVMKSLATTDSLGRATFKRKWSSTSRYRVITAASVAVPSFKAATYTMRVR